MKINVDSQEFNTILAALRFYQENDQGTPSSRSDAIHDLATNGDAEVSLDNDAIDGLCERINFGSARLPKSWTALQNLLIDTLGRTVYNDAIDNGYTLNILFRDLNPKRFDLLQAGIFALVEDDRDAMS